MEHCLLTEKFKKVRLLASGKKIPEIKKQVDFGLINFMGKPKSEFPFTLLPDTIQETRLWARSKHEFQIADAYDYWAEELQKMYTDSLKYFIGNKR